MIAGFDQWNLAGKVYKTNFPKARFYSGKLENAKVRNLAKELGKIDLISRRPSARITASLKARKEDQKKAEKLLFKSFALLGHSNPVGW